MRRLRLPAGLLLLTLATLAAAQTPPTVDTSGWTILREPRLGFALKHPPSWRVSRGTGTLESVLLGEPTAGGTPRVLIQVFVQRNINPRGLSSAEWYAEQLRRLNVSSPPPITSTRIGGRPTIRREMVRPDGPQYDFYTAVNAGDVFQVSITTTAPDGLDPTREAVLATITFLQ